jgi:hypothetical protein
MTVFVLRWLAVLGMLLVGERIRRVWRSGWSARVVPSPEPPSRGDAAHQEHPWEESFSAFRDARSAVLAWQRVRVGQRMVEVVEIRLEGDERAADARALAGRLAQWVQHNHALHAVVVGWSFAPEEVDAGIAGMTVYSVDGRGVTGALEDLPLLQWGRTAGWVGQSVVPGWGDGPATGLFIPPLRHEEGFAGRLDTPPATQHGLAP